MGKESPMKISMGSSWVLAICGCIDPCLYIYILRSFKSIYWKTIVYRLSSLWGKYAWVGHRPKFFVCHASCAIKPRGGGAS